MNIDNYDFAKMLSITEARVAEAYGPIFGLGKAIILAAVDTAEDIKPLFQGKEPRS